MESKNIKQFIVDEDKITADLKNQRYYLTFKNYEKSEITEEISEKMYLFYLEEHLKDMRYDNKRRKYIEQSEQTENQLYTRAFKKPKTVEDSVIDNIMLSTLRTAKNTLTEIQLERVELHYEDGVTIRELAIIKNVRKKQIEKSIYDGFKKIKKYFKK